MSQPLTRKEVFQIIRAGDYTSIGSHPVVLLCADGGTIHPHCARENALLVGRAARENDKQWHVIAADCNWEDPDLICDHCGERIESAYAEPEAPPMPEEFFEAFLECALWSSTECDEDGNMGSPLDENYGPEDFDPKTLAGLRADCEGFWQANAETMLSVCDDASQHGHDFWLTRNGHGAGFWDRGYGAIGDELSKAAKVYGGVDLMARDGKVHS